MIKDYNNCFVCGKDNPLGLKLSFKYQDKIASASFNLPKTYEGYDGIIHGGIIAAILDEAMAKAILYNEIKAVTVKLNITYKKPLQPNYLYVVEGVLKSIKRKTICTQATIFDGNTIYAYSEAKFFIIT